MLLIKPYTKDIGFKTNPMEKGDNHLKIKKNNQLKKAITLETFRMGKSMEKEYSIGQMAKFTMDNLKMVKCTGRENFPSLGKKANLRDISSKDKKLVGCL
jgi:hypothetical protein